MPVCLTVQQACSYREQLERIPVHVNTPEVLLKYCLGEPAQYTQKEMLLCFHLQTKDAIKIIILYYKYYKKAQNGMASGGDAQTRRLPSLGNATR